MKYSNFVNEDNKAFTEDELNSFANHFAKEVGKFTNVKYELSSYIEDCGTAIVSFSFPKIENVRNSNNDRILLFSELNVGIFKNAGYLDTWDWVNKGAPEDESYKDYKNAPEFQYTAFLTTNGIIEPNEILETKKQYVRGDYQYGTEIEDINFEKYLDTLFNKILK